LVSPTHGWAFSFHDLLSLAVVAVFRQRKVTPAGVRETIRQLQIRFNYDKPLANADVVEGLATVGRSVILTDEGTDVSAGSQGVLLETVQRYLLPVTYGSDRLARLWQPAERIQLDPDVQVGHPCVQSTRITTETLAGRAAQGEPHEVIADDLGITVEDVAAATAFETKLDLGRGLALVA
jgi:uncharacterized protein (DUF433 family)